VLNSVIFFTFATFIPLFLFHTREQI